MDWRLALWTALSWLFSGGTLYLVYQFGVNCSVEQGVRWKSWQSVGLLMAFVLSLAFYGVGYPIEGLTLEFDADIQARFAGIFFVIVVTYLAGFLEGRWKDRSTTPDGRRVPGKPPSIVHPG